MDLGPARFQFRCSSLIDSFNAHFQDSQMADHAAYYGHRSLYVDCLWASLLMGIAARGLLMGCAAYYGQRCLLGGSGRRFGAGGYDPAGVPLGHPRAGRVPAHAVRAQVPHRSPHGAPT